MKKIIVITAYLFTSFFLLTGCEKELDWVSDITNVPSDQAMLKVNYASAYRYNPAVQIKLNDTRMSSTISYPYPYPGGGLNTGGSSAPDYFTVTPGTVKIGISIPNAGANTDSIPLITENVTLEAGKHYTFHTADTGTNTQTLLITENVSKPDTGISRYKFVNLMPDLPALDLYFGTALVAGNIAFMDVSADFNIRRDSAAQWSIRPAGALPTSTPITTYPTGTGRHTVPRERVLTVFARGYSTITSSTDPRRGQISLFYNR